MMQCLYCDEPIRMGDELARFPIGTQDGVRIAHIECAYRAVAGGVNHLKGLCTCCGGTQPPDPPELSRRDAARAALDYAQPGWRER